MLDYENYPVIAAVRGDADFEKALLSDVQAVFLLSSDIMTVENFVARAHEKQKLLFIHVDFVDGLSKDAAGVHYLSTKSIDGIISTRVNIIKTARELGLFTVQRFFIVDSQSIYTTIDSVKSAKPDMIEIMPALLYKTLSRLSHELSTPIIAGGLIESEDELNTAIFSGAVSVSTGKRELWEK